MFALLLVLTNPLKTISFDDIAGRWIGMYYNGNVILEIKKNNKCFLEIRNVASAKSEKISGDCDIDYSKIPYTLVISDIPELSTSLYSLIVPINNNIIHISEFSNKWKLRPVTLTQKNTIILKRYIY